LRATRRSGGENLDEIVGVIDMVVDGRESLHSRRAAPAPAAIALLDERIVATAPAPAAEFTLALAPPAIASRRRQGSVLRRAVRPLFPG
jgi:hypothetical protein